MIKQFWGQKINDWPVWDRPLLVFLPFFLLGLYGGKENGQLESSCLFIITLFLFVFTFFCLWRKTILIMAILPLTLFCTGWLLINEALMPPTDDPGHVINYIEATKSRPAIIGAEVLEIKSQTNGKSQLLLKAGEIFFPSPAGPDKYEQIHGLLRLKLASKLKIQVGDYLRFPAKLGSIEGFKNPHLSSYKDYWNGQGLWVETYIKSSALVGLWPQRKNPLLAQLREKAEKIIEAQTIDETAKGLLKAQLLGLRSQVDERGEEIFRVLGLSHILSVSGLHLSLCFAFSFFLAKMFWRLALRPWPTFKVNLAATLSALLPTLFYALLVGQASPVLRAAIMVSLVAAGLFFQRKVGALNLLALAAWAILLVEPARLFTISFQLSFVATAIMILAFSTKVGRKKPGLIQSSARAGIFGSLGTAPLVVWHFGYFPAAGILANIVLTPLISFLVMPLGLLSISLALVWPHGAILLFKLPADAFELLLKPMAFLADLAGPGFLFTAPSFIFTILWYLALSLFLILNYSLRQRLVISVGLIILALALNQLYYHFKYPLTGALRLTVLDIGHGSAQHLSLPNGEQLLIDGGGSLNFDPAPSIIVPYFLRQNIKKLDYVVLTHPDLDHLRGLILSTSLFKPQEIWQASWPPNWSSFYKEFLAVSQKIKTRQPELAEIFQQKKLGGADFTFFWPPLPFPQLAPGDTKKGNDLGLVFKVSFGAESVLFTGDIGVSTEKELVARFGKKLQATILIAPHHGSRRSASAEFLAAVQPEIVVVSVGRYNGINLPHPETVARIKKVGANIWRTDQNGAFVWHSR